MSITNIKLKHVLCCSTLLDFENQTDKVKEMTDNREVILDDNHLYEIEGELYSLNELKGFLEASKTVERQTRFITALKFNNSKLTVERNQLQADLDAEKNKYNEFYEKEYMYRIEECNRLWGELFDIKHLSLWEFAAKYCNDEQLEDAGHQLAKSLGVGVKATKEEMDIDKAENNYVPYTAEDF